VRGKLVGKLSPLVNCGLEITAISKKTNHCYCSSIFRDIGMKMSLHDLGRLKETRVVMGRK
jgi:hypothetical protein